MKILTIPDPVLKTKCENVTDFDLSYLVPDMVTIAEDSNLAGLAANQVNHLVRVFIMNMFVMDSNSHWMAFVNPSFKPVQSGGKSWAFEGCGSIPGREAMVERWNKITYTAQDQNGTPITGELSGFLARVFQHETDHLNGILLTDKRVRQWRRL